MFHEYREIIVKIKAQDKYFEKLFDKHNEMDEEIVQLEKSHADQFEIEKKEKRETQIKR